MVLFRGGVRFSADQWNEAAPVENRHSDVTSLPEDQLQFLTSILQACQLNLGDVAIVNRHRHKLSWEDIRDGLNCNYLLIFGTAPAELGLKELTEFIPQKTGNCNIILSPVPEELNNNSVNGKVLKSKLWVCLKQLFNL